MKLALGWLCLIVVATATLSTACTPPLVELGANISDQLRPLVTDSWRIEGSSVVVNDIAVDAEGTVYLTGRFHSAATLGGNRIAPGLPTLNEMILIALSAKGEVRWYLDFAPPVSLDVIVKRVVAHPEGGVVFSFFTERNTTLGSRAFEAGSWIVRMSAAGEVINAIPRTSFPHQLALDTDANIYASGTQNSVNNEYYVDKLDADGMLLWRQPILFRPLKLAVGAAGLWAVSGYTPVSTHIDFPDGTYRIAPASLLIAEFSDQRLIRVADWEELNAENVVDNPITLAYADTDLETWVRFEGEFDWVPYRGDTTLDSYVITAPSSANPTSPEAYFRTRIPSVGEAPMPLVVAGTHSESLDALLSWTGDNTIAIGRFSGVLSLGDGQTLLEPAEEAVTLFLTAIGEDERTLWRSAFSIGIAEEGMLTAAGHLDGGIALAYEKTAGTELILNRIELLPVQNDSLAWKDRCRPLHAPTELADALIMLRPEVSPSNELQPLFSGSCYDAPPGSLVRVYRDAACSDLIGSALVHDGAFTVESGAQAIPWNGEADGDLAFFAEAESDQGLPLTDCVDLDVGYVLDSGTWTNLSNEGAPEARHGQSMFWTGSEVIVWGGEDPDSFSVGMADGARYNPATDTWTPISSTAKLGGKLRDYVAVWAEERSQMLVWGGDNSTGTSLGLKNDGAIYDVASDTWTKISSAPLPKTAEAAGVWTGTELIVWGGRTPHGGDEPASLSNEGARYDPVTDTWSLIAVDEHTPSARKNASAVWTGNEMFVFGGSYTTEESPDGGRYNPATDTWQPFAAPAAWALGDIARPELLWDGEWVWLIGGYGSLIGYGSVDGDTVAARFNPATEEWVKIDSREIFQGSRAAMVDGALSVFGRCDSSPSLEFEMPLAAFYLDERDSWRILPAPPPGPLKRCLASMVWTGTEMIVWGGAEFITTFPVTTYPFSTRGYRYAP